jgi:UDP-N-acetyl-D-glucosamine dehydrogenase
MGSVAEGRRDPLGLGLCGEAGVFVVGDVDRLVRQHDGAATKPFGFEAFHPGPGVGGHCIPVDPTYLSHHVRVRLGRPFRLIELAQEINAGMPVYVVERLRDELDRVGKVMPASRVLLVGISYKSDVADLRETPAADVVRNLRRLGATIEVLDPLIDGWEVDGEALKQVEPSDASGFDATVVLQHHSSVSPEIVLESSDVVLDTRARIRGPNVTYL